MKCNVKLVFNFHLILLGIPSSLILSIRNRRWEVSLSRQNIFSMTKFICQWSLGTKQLIKTNKNTNKKLSRLVLICGSIAASALWHLISCDSSSFSLVSLKASSPQHKSRCSCRQHSHVACLLLLVSPLLLFSDPHFYLQVSKMKWK